MEFIKKFKYSIGIIAIAVIVAASFLVIETSAFNSSSASGLRVCHIVSITLPSGSIIYRTDPQFNGLLTALRHGAPFESTIECKEPFPFPIKLPPIPADVEFE
jgi:hypothetical protein